VSRRRIIVAAAGLAAVALLTTPGMAAAKEKPVVPGTRLIRVVTPTNDVGEHPTLRWKPVKGVESYAAFVHTKGGDPYWAWRGDATHVRFGGDSPDAVKNSEGAALTTKRVWFVFGFNDEGTVIASSARRKIAP
jgi:hypothetical protein